jgi:hypothetical protein
MQKQLNIQIYFLSKINHEKLKVASFFKDGDNWKVNQPDEMKGSRNAAQAGIGQVREHCQPENEKSMLGRWVAKLVARLLATAALWVRTSLKNTGRHKQRSGQHTLARQKNIKNRRQWGPRTNGWSQFRIRQLRIWIVFISYLQHFHININIENASIKSPIGI